MFAPLGRGDRGRPGTLRDVRPPQAPAAERLTAAVIRLVGPVRFNGGFGTVRR